VSPHHAVMEVSDTSHSELKEIIVNKN